jgi:hypothetical protein
MFVGLTHVTVGLDAVQPGGRDDPDRPRYRGGRRFRTWTRPMLAAFGVGGLLLVLGVGRYIG